MRRSPPRRLPRASDAFLPCRAAVVSCHATYLSGVMRRFRRAIRSCWRNPTLAGRPAWSLVHLRKGEMFAELAAGFPVGTSTAWRYVTEAVGLLAARAPEIAIRTACRLGGRLRVCHD